MLLERLDPRLELAHSRHRLVLSLGQLEKGQLDQYGQENNGPAPVIDELMDVRK